MSDYRVRQWHEEVCKDHPYCYRCVIQIDGSDWPHPWFEVIEHRRVGSTQELYSGQDGWTKTVYSKGFKQKNYWTRAVRAPVITHALRAPAKSRGKSSLVRVLSWSGGGWRRRAGGPLEVVPAPRPMPARSRALLG